MEKIDEIIKFISDYGEVSYDLEEFRENLLGFIKNKTFIILEKEGIAAICLWNIDGDIAKVEEVVIHPKHRKKGLLKYIALLGLQKFPHLRMIQFCRDRKYEGREPHVIDIYKFIRRKHGKSKNPRTSTVLPASSSTHSR